MTTLILVPRVAKSVNTFVSVRKLTTTSASQERTAARKRRILTRLAIVAEKGFGDLFVPPMIILRTFGSNLKMSCFVSRKVITVRGSPRSAHVFANVLETCWAPPPPRLSMTMTVRLVNVSSIVCDKDLRLAQRDG